MNAVVEVQDTQSGVMKIELAIGAATRRLADTEASQEQLQARRRRALAGDGVPGQLHDKRKAALAAGHDSEVEVLDAAISKSIDQIIDPIDAELAAAQKTVTRERDRLQVLEEDLAEAKIVEQQRSMDAVFNRANAARKFGEVLILEYAQWSAKGLNILSTMVAIETFIRESNAILAGRTNAAPVDALSRQVAEANDVRRIPDQIIPATTREVERCVGGGNSFPRQYRYETVTEEVPEQRIPGSWQPELYEGCVIVPVMPGDLEWDKHGRAKAEAEKRYEQIIDAIV